MFKNIKRLAALVLALALCLVFTGCHKKGEIAVKVSCEGYDDEFTSGFYACAFLYADSEAQAKVSEKMTQAQTMDADFDYRAQKIDGKTYEEWVKARALEICKELFAYKAMCLKNKVPTADILAEAGLMAETYWNGYGYSELFEPNGVSFETYKLFSEYQEYKTAYFNYLYGENGPKEVPATELETFLKEKYAYVNVLAVDISTLGEEQLEEKQKEFKKYEERLKKGENFGKIYAEVNEGEYTANEKDKGIFNNNIATVWGAEGTSFENVYFDKIKDLKNDEYVTFTTDDEQGKYIILVVRGDILQEGNESLDSYKDSVRHELKDDEYTKLMTSVIKKVKLQEIKRATRPFKIEKIVYPES